MTPKPPAPETFPPRVREVLTDSGLRTFFYAVGSPSFLMAETLAAAGNSGVDLGREYISLLEHDHELREAVKWLKHDNYILRAELTELLEALRLNKGTIEQQQRIQAARESCHKFLEHIQERERSPR